MFLLPTGGREAVSAADSRYLNLLSDQNQHFVKKFTVNLHDGDRLSYTQAEELSLATVHRSQQLYTAEQWLSCKKEVGERYPFPFPPSLPSAPPFSLPCREAAL